MTPCRSKLQGLIGDKPKNPRAFAGSWTARAYLERPYGWRVARCLSCERRDESCFACAPRRLPFLTRR